MTSSRLQTGGVDVLHGRWAKDVRGEGRAVRVSAHAAAGFLILSTWKADECVGTVRLVPNEAAELLAGIGEGLADLASDPTRGTGGNDPNENRLRKLELRLDQLESLGQADLRVQSRRLSQFRRMLTAGKWTSDRRTR